MNKSMWKSFVAGLETKELSTYDLLQVMEEADALGKNPYMAVMGKLGGSKGGKATAKKLNEGELSDRGFIASMVAKRKRRIELEPRELTRVRQIKKDRGWAGAERLLKYKEE